MKKVLAVINYWPTADMLVSKAKEIAAAIKAEVCVYCPVSSQIEEMNRYVGFENFEDVKLELINECKMRLEALPGIEELETIIDWQSQMYRGVANRAESISAEMVLMSRSEHNFLGDLLHRPDDWHLLREAPCPVLVMNLEHSPYRSVIAAVDALEDDDQHRILNARILDEAQMMAEILGLPLSVITVVPEPSYIYSDMTTVGSVTLSKFSDQLLATAEARQQQMLLRLGVKPHTAKVVIGPVVGELQSAMSASGLLVMGTIANKGLKGFFLGNTSERLLSHMQGDMLVVN